LHDLYAFTFLITYARADTTENGSFAERWRWSRPDVHVYTSLIRGLAASLRVSDALRIIEDICQMGVSPGEEV
jgi:pentatricopeptide repeat protein